MQGNDMYSIDSGSQRSGEIQEEVVKSVRILLLRSRERQQESHREMREKMKSE